MILQMILVMQLIEYHHWESLIFKSETKLDHRGEIPRPTAYGALAVIYRVVVVGRYDYVCVWSFDIKK